MILCKEILWCLDRWMNMVYINDHEWMWRINVFNFPCIGKTGTQSDEIPMSNYVWIIYFDDYVY